jgi:hypothetical protein
MNGKGAKQDETEQFQRGVIFLHMLENPAKFLEFLPQEIQLYTVLHL